MVDALSSPVGKLIKPKSAEAEEEPAVDLFVLLLVAVALTLAARLVKRRK